MTTAKHFFRASAEDFKKVPGSPVAYWVSEALMSTFGNGVSVDSISDFTGSQHKTADNERFLRCIWEVSKEKVKRNGWLIYIKGGEFRKWYGNIDLVVDWTDSAKEFYKTNPTSNMLAERYWLKEGITYTSLSAGKNGFRYLPPVGVFDIKGPSLINVKHLEYCLSLFNSPVAQVYFRQFNATMTLQVKDVKNVPLIIDTMSEGIVRDTTKELVSIAHADWDSYETSWDFTVNPLVATRSVSGASDKSAFQLSSLYAAVRARWAKNCEEMRRLETENNRIFIEAYGLQDELTPEVPWHEITLTCNPWYRYGVKEVEKVGGGGDFFPLNPELEARLKSDTVKELISYAVGCMMGRYAIDKPGLILADQGSTYGDYLAKVSEPEFDPDEDGIIPVIDEDCFADDIVIQFHKFLRTAFGAANFNANLSFIEEAIGKDLRSYFTKDFYADHLQRYQKRPIYWLFSSPKGTFSALVYLHRYHPGTVGQVLTYLRSHITNLKSRLDAADRTTADPSATQGMKTKAIKERTKLMRQLKELEDYERDVLHPLASERLEIDLDDGVKVNYPKFGKALRKIPGFE